MMDRARGWQGARGNGGGCVTARAAHTAFDTAHPAVAATYVSITLAITMCSLQPVLIALSFAGAFAYACCVHGPRTACASMRWQLPLIALIAFVNPLFSASGSTELFRIGTRAVYLESLCFGCAMGALFVASALWFQAAAQLVPYDRVLALFSNAAPVLALMISQCMRLIPRFVRQGRLIAAVQDAAAPGNGRERARAEGEPSRMATGDRTAACAVAAPGTTRGAAGCSAQGRRADAPARSRFSIVGSAARGRLRLSTVLMGWTLEDSLETADAMRARGWGAAPRRTSYVRYRFTRQDAAALAALVLAGALCLVLAVIATGQFHFYPQLSALTLWWGYAPCALWMLLPTVLHLREERRFR